MSIRTIIKQLLVSLLLVLSFSQLGYAMTTQETSQYIKIPIVEWNAWKNDWTILDSELTACKSELQKIKKPSSELLQQLAQAEKMLKQLQEELQRQNDDLTMLSRQAEESKTLLQTLKTQIDKERRTHRRQIWQNRIWVFIGGVVVGYLIK